MRELDQIQRWMRAVVMHPGGASEGVASAEARQMIDLGPEEVEQVVVRSRALSGLERLEIYNRGYFARLVECLREEFPVLAHALGEATFDEFAVDYLQRYPSRSYTLNLLGAKFPRFLEETRPEDDTNDGTGVNWPDFLIDLAQLELTYSEVFDGPGVERQPLLDAARLGAISPERWPETRLVPVCCLRLLTLRYPVHKYYSAVRKEKKPRFPKPRPTYLAVTRRRFVVRRFELTWPQYVLLNALIMGQSVGEAICLTVEKTAGDLDDLAGQLREWFFNWTAEGFFQDAQESPN
jgi:hypothetical protein